jgi:hypothetical protein
MRPVERLTWLVRRASVMSGAEVVHRVRGSAEQGVRRVAAALRLVGEPGWPYVDVEEHRFLKSADAQLFVPAMATSREDERRALEGGVPVFGCWVPWRDDASFWHADHLFEKVWPRQRTATLEHRPGNPTGDARIVWEPNRLQHFLLLARAAAADAHARARAATLFEAQLRSWVEANAPGMGIQHSSAMEQALRILSVTHAFDLARPHLPPAAAELVGQVVMGEALDVERRLSLHSSAGNHTIAEAVGLLYAGVLFAEHPRAAIWERMARELLRDEVPRQIRPDGGGIEQATWYLLFVADLLGLAQELLAHRQLAPIVEVDCAVARARRFLQGLGSSPRDLPRIGDCDDGYALSPDLLTSWRPSEEGTAAREFPETGLSVVASPHERLVFVHGPLGMPPSCGHGHADCLSVLFRHRDVDLLIDPGTYLYGGPPSLRRYFRSTAAHNTLGIGGRDQAEQVAPFMWKGEYRCEVVLSRLGGGEHSILARHDAYRSLGFTHWRGVAYSPGRFLAIWDHLDGPADADVAVHWHFGCPVRLEPGAREAWLQPAGVEPIRMTLPDGPAQLFHGSQDPLLGWSSMRYGSLEPCFTVVSRPSNRARPEAVTTLWLAGGERPRREVEVNLERFRGALAKDGAKLGAL